MEFPKGWKLSVNSAKSIQTDIGLLLFHLVLASGIEMLLWHELQLPSATQNEIWRAIFKGVTQGRVRQGIDSAIDSG